MDKNLALLGHSLEPTDILIASPKDASQTPTAVRRMIALFDGSRTVEQVCLLSQISVAKGLAVVRKLAGEGILHQGPPLAEVAYDVERADTLLDLSPLPGELQGFSPEEEAFFNSEVEPIDEWVEEPSLRDRIGFFISDLIFRCKGSPAFY